jgi:hypothetical protein
MASKTVPAAPKMSAAAEMSTPTTAVTPTASATRMRKGDSGRYDREERQTGRSDPRHYLFTHGRPQMIRFEFQGLTSMQSTLTTSMTRLFGLAVGLRSSGKGCAIEWLSVETIYALRSRCVLDERFLMEHSRSFNGQDVQSG